MLMKNFRKYLLRDVNLVACFKWVKDPYRKVPNMLKTAAVMI